MEPNGKEDGWISQEKRRKKRRKRKEKQENGPEVVEDRLLEACAELKTSEFWDSCKRTVLKRIREHFAPLPDFGNLRLDARLEPGTREISENGVLRCVCYGAGNFASCSAARIQLAFLISLLDELRIPRHFCDVFDPAFSSAEIESLRRLGFAVVAENEEGKRGIGGVPTVFFMVHCGKALYNNLLWSNWDPEALPKMAVVGNSFRGVAERTPRRIFEKDYGYIAKVSDAAVEVPFPRDPSLGDAFEDTAVHFFPSSEIGGLPSEIWASPEEPAYRAEDLEIVRKEK